jgi:bifunctional ADP-heptose synthase (sugar kinase/adenylyltransferase)
LLARTLGGFRNTLVVCVNSDESCKRLKAAKWGINYPRDSQIKRMENVSKFADITCGFDDEETLHRLIERYMPCVIVKGPDYAGKRVTGDDIAPVIILDTPEPESVKAMKRQVYFGE